MPELSSSTAWMPWSRSSDSITEAPRSLKLPVGMNHSHFSSAVAPPKLRGTSGVQPSPMVIGAPASGGSAAR